MFLLYQRRDQILAQLEDLAAEQSALLERWDLFLSHCKLSNPVVLCGYLVAWLCPQKTTPFNKYAVHHKQLVHVVYFIGMIIKMFFAVALFDFVLI